MKIFISNDNDDAQNVENKAYLCPIIAFLMATNLKVALRIMDCFGGNVSVKDIEKGPLSIGV